MCLCPRPRAGVLPDLLPQPRARKSARRSGTRRSRLGLPWGNPRRGDAPAHPIFAAPSKNERGLGRHVASSRESSQPEAAGLDNCPYLGRSYYRFLSQSVPPTWWRQFRRPCGRQNPPRGSKPPPDGWKLPRCGRAWCGGTCAASSEPEGPQANRRRGGNLAARLASLGRVGGPRGRAAKRMRKFWPAQQPPPRDVEPFYKLLFTISLPPITLRVPLR